jgi:hypothetical protein
VEIKLHSLYTLELDAGEQSDSQSGCFNPELTATTGDKARWGPESVWTWLQKEKSLLLPTTDLWPYF